MHQKELAVFYMLKQKRFGKLWVVKKSAYTLENESGSSSKKLNLIKMLQFKLKKNTGWTTGKIEKKSNLYHLMQKFMKKIRQTKLTILEIFIPNLKHLRLPEPTPIQYDIADYLANGRCIISAFRGVGKSWITASYVLWRLLLDNDLNILVVSASKNRADDFSTFCLRLMSEMPILKHLYPKGDQRQSKISFDVATAGSITTT